jgi:ribosome maturation factor RimP
VVDRDQGVTLDDIAEVSKAVSDVLDRNDDGMGRTPYVLEVTSPGVDRPLTEPRHWRRNIGRLVTVPVGPSGSADTVTGRITAVEDAGVTIAVEVAGKPGAKKRPPTPRQVPWGELGAGRVQVEFGRAVADDAEDIDDTDVDDIDDTDTDIDGRAEPQVTRGGGQ